jgi:hypothetical protein
VEEKSSAINNLKKTNRLHTSNPSLGMHWSYRYETRPALVIRLSLAIKLLVALS